MLKAYFWVVFVFCVLEVLTGLLMGGVFGFIVTLIFLMIVGIFPLFPVYSYSFKKVSLSLLIWKAYLLLSLIPTLFLIGITWIYPIVAFQKAVSMAPWFFWFPLVFILFLLPGYYSLYKLAFKNK